MINGEYRRIMADKPSNSNVDVRLGPKYAPDTYSNMMMT